MSFDSNSLKRLSELGRKLPKSIPLPKDSSKSNQNLTSNLHPIETERNPQRLFKELIKASNNGEVPPHLIERLKLLEAQEVEKKNALQKDSQPPIQNDDLYISFRQLLLEEDQA